MTNSKIIFQDLLKQIDLDGDEEEASSIAFIVMEHVFGLSKTDIATENPLKVPFPEEQIQTIIRRINQHEPIQYILGETYFYGYKFQVTPAVLIPRPETEELVRVVISMLSGRKDPVRILDVGTGSGCISVTLALEIYASEVFATDISEGALTMAKKNAERLKGNVKFIHHDIRKEIIPFTNLDVIVSNPPYIALSEKLQMKSNVTGHEPHLALFVEDNNPLLFYHAILNQSKMALRIGGIIAVEINERFGRAVAGIFAESNTESIEVLKDISGKDRIVIGRKVG